MPTHDPDYTVRIVDANGDPDWSVITVDGIDNLSPNNGDLLQWNGTAWVSVPSSGIIGAYVPKSLYDANTVLAATTDDTPAALTVGASTILGRGSAGGIAALTAAQAKTVLAIAESDVASLTADLSMLTTAAAAAQTTANAAVPKSLYDANTILMATTDDTPVALTVAASTFVGRKAAGGISAMSVAEAKTLLALVVGDVSGAAPLASPTFTGTLTAATTTLGTSTLAAGATTLQPATSGIGLIVKAAATTPGDIQEWQASGGTLLAKVSSTGVFTINAINGANLIIASTAGSAWINFTTVTNSRAWTIGIGTEAGGADQFSIRDGGTSITRFLLDASDTTLTTPVSTGVGLIIKGAASQSADLQRWTSSTPTTLSAVNAGGTYVSDVAAGGVVLKDTQGSPHYWRVTVSTLGVLTTTDLGTTRPTT